MSECRAVVDCGNVLGESVRWDARTRRVLWADIDRAELWWLDPATSEVGKIDMPERLCAFAARRSGGLLVAFASKLAYFHADWGVTVPIPDSGPGETDTRWNDGRCDRRGRFLIGSSYEGSAGKRTASLWQFDGVGRKRLVSGVRVSNAICFSPDGKTMYFADSIEASIWAFDYDEESGSIANRREFCSLQDQPGVPDGATVDEAGYLWNAQWGGGRILRYRPDGSVDRIVELPISQPTCVSFGGPDLSTLYITSARLGLSREQLEREPLAGSLFALTPGVKGLPENLYAG